MKSAASDISYYRSYALIDKNVSFYASLRVSCLPTYWCSRIMSSYIAWWYRFQMTNYRRLLIESMLSHFHVVFVIDMFVLSKMMLNIWNPPSIHTHDSWLDRVDVMNYGYRRINILSKGQYVKQNFRVGRTISVAINEHSQYHWFSSMITSVHHWTIEIYRIYSTFIVDNHRYTLTRVTQLVLWLMS
jgi:hypothetical protein